ncbi:MAG TPA: YwmB family TATA-box binding protein [Clostridia bacterium]|nr:YwmB family TATA-box binding protein [Clostridia bacterium]
MKKRVLLLLVCILLTFGSFDAVANPIRKLTEEEALITSFESTGAEVLESTISCWTKLNDKFLTTKQIEAEMAKIVKRINPDKATAVKNLESSDQLNKIVFYGSKGNKAYNIAIESAKQGAGGETYIVADASMDKSYRDLAAERQNIANAIQVDEDSINFSSCIIGTYKGKLEERDAEKKSRIALQSINARKVEGIENEELKSISAFSSSVGGYIMSNQARVNVQLAIRYSSYDDKTYIWIGTPLIPMGY